MHILETVAVVLAIILFGLWIKGGGDPPLAPA